MKFTGGKIVSLFHFAIPEIKISQVTCRCCPNTEWRKKTWNRQENMKNQFFYCLITQFQLHVEHFFFSFRLLQFLVLQWQRKHVNCCQFLFSFYDYFSIVGGNPCFLVVVTLTESTKTSSALTETDIKCIRNRIIGCSFMLSHFRYTQKIYFISLFDIFLFIYRCHFRLFSIISLRLIK